MDIVFHRQEELQLLQRQLEEREAELQRLKDDNRLQVESHNRAEGGERGGRCFNNCLGASCFIDSNITKGFKRIRQIDVSHSNNNRTP